MPYFAPESRKQNLITNLNTGAHQYKHCTRIMKTQVKEQLEKMVNEFNNRCERTKATYRYAARFSEFDKDSWACSLVYELFYSDDFTAFMEFALEHKLYVMSSPLKCSEKAYMEIQ